jgi:hypothetical protein
LPSRCKSFNNDANRATFAQKTHNNVPVIVGSNANEMTSLTGTASAPKTMEEFKRRIAQQYGELASESEFGSSITTGTHLLKRELDFQEKALNRRR